jgi:hypothetical protein
MNWPTGQSTPGFRGIEQHQKPLNLQLFYSFAAQCDTYGTVCRKQQILPLQLLFTSKNCFTNIEKQIVGHSKRVKMTAPFTELLSAALLEEFLTRLQRHVFWKPHVYRVARLVMLF